MEPMNPLITVVAACLAFVGGMLIATCAQGF